MHTDNHPLAGKTVLLNDTAADNVRNIVVPGARYRIEGWWDQLTGRSWMFSDGNWAAMHYGMRSGMRDDPLPNDDEVLYGHIGAFSHLVHVSELGEVVEDD
jgi:hypothetical protein